jgi:hypothetical protein
VPDTSTEYPKFRLTRFNPRRLRPNCSGAAEVEIQDEDGSSFRLWMTRLDVERNLIEFGPQSGLMAALEAYRNGVEIKEGC